MHRRRRSMVLIPVIWGGGAGGEGMHRRRQSVVPIPII